MLICKLAHLEWSKRVFFSPWKRVENFLKINYSKNDTFRCSTHNVEFQPKYSTNYAQITLKVRLEWYPMHTSFSRSTVIDSFTAVCSITIELIRWQYMGGKTVRSTAVCLNVLFFLFSLNVLLFIFGMIKQLKLSQTPPGFLIWLDQKIKFSIFNKNQQIIF